MPRQAHTTRSDGSWKDSYLSSDKELSVKEMDEKRRRVLKGLPGLDYLTYAPCEEDQRIGFQHTVERLDEVYRMGANVLLACEASVDGVLCATAATYFAKTNKRRVRVCNRLYAEPQLFDLIVETQTYYAMAERVLNGFMAKVQAGCPVAIRHGCRGRCRFGCIRNIAYIGAAVDDTNMPDALYRYVKAGLDNGSELQHMEADPYVSDAYEIARAVSAECEHARQFIRFSKLANGVYFAPFRPKADVTPLVARHFMRRMGPTPFTIVDELHGSVLMCVDGEHQLVRLEPWEAQELVRKVTVSDDEAYIRAMWKTFYDAVSLPGRDKTRRGYDLRLKWMPKRLWTYLPELTPGAESAYDTVPEKYAKINARSLNRGSEGDRLTS